MTVGMIAFAAPVLFAAVILAFAAYVVRANRHPPDNRDRPPGE